MGDKNFGEKKERKGRSRERERDRIERETNTETVRDKKTAPLAGGSKREGEREGEIR